MIGRDKRVLLRHYLEQGMTKAAIARHVGVSRDTIYRWIATGQLDRDLDEQAVRYRPRPPVPSKLDPYKAIIDGRLAEYPTLTATRLLREVEDAGYPGSYSPGKAIRATGSASASGGACAAVRDPSGPPRVRWTSRTSG